MIQKGWPTFDLSKTEDAAKVHSILSNSFWLTWNQFKLVHFNFILPYFFDMFQNFANIWIISGPTFFLPHGPRSTEIKFNSFQFNWHQVCSTQINLIQFKENLFKSIQTNSIEFDSIQFQWIQLFSVLFFISFDKFQNFVNIWIISGLTVILHHGLRSTDINVV